MLVSKSANVSLPVTIDPRDVLSGPARLRRTLHVLAAAVRGGRIRVMTTREKIEAVLNNMPESELEPVLEILVSRQGSEYDPEAARPGDIIDEWGNLSALRRASSVRKLDRLDEEEIAEHGETIGDAFARAEADRESQG
jgi:hypothetical protein